MKKKLYFILFCIYSIVITAQINPYFDINLKKGNRAYASKNYSSAITFYNNALSSKGITGTQRQLVKNKIQQSHQKLRVINNSKSKLTSSGNNKDKKELLRLQREELKKLKEERARLKAEADSLAKQRNKEEQKIRNEQLRQALFKRYDLVDKFHEGLARVHKNLLYGYINESGIEVIPLNFDFASDFAEGLASVQLGDKFGFIDHEGKIVIGFKYEYAGDFSDGLAAVQIDDKMGYINKEGTLVINPEYSIAHNFENGEAEVEKGGIYYFINKIGVCVKNCKKQESPTNVDSIQISQQEKSKVKIVPVLSDEHTTDDKYKDLLIDKSEIPQEEQD